MKTMLIGGLVGATIAVLVLVLRTYGSGRSDPSAPPPGPPTMEEVHRQLAAGRKIAAIKIYRELHNTGLKEAKEAVERLVKDLPRS